MSVTSEILSGEERRPVNPAQSGSIHDDSVAQKLGFRGGTIAGSIHLEQFVPLLLEAFGAEWFRSGSLSAYFRYATLHDEPVRCFLRKPERSADVQVEAWMDTPSGQRVCEGTASVGRPPEPVVASMIMMLRFMKASSRLWEQS